MRGFLIALTFLSRIPIPAPKDVTEREFKQSQQYYPFVGLLIGCLLYGAGFVANFFYPPLITGAILLACEIWLTGGIHLDGFMDSMDGLLSARTPERMLEIMKDSRVGAHSAITLAALLILKFSLFTSLTPNNLKVLIIIPMLSRWAFLIGIKGFPYARAEGLGQGFHENSRWLVFIIEGVVALILATWICGYAGILASAAALIFAALFSWRVAKILGGLTGDIYGATIELTEVISLAAVFPLLNLFH